VDLDRASPHRRRVDSYNDHLLAAPLVVYQLLFRTVGLGDYTVYLVIAAVAHLVCIATVFASCGGASA
jgi:hypothetical protein